MEPQPGHTGFSGTRQTESQGQEQKQELLAPGIGLSTSIRFYVSLAGLGVTTAIRLSSPLSGPDLGDHGDAGLLLLF